MLQLTGRHAFGMNIRYLFHLERALKGDGEVDASGYVVEVIPVPGLLCQHLELLVVLGHVLFDPGTDGQKVLQSIIQPVGHGERQQVEKRQLADEGLGGSDSYLGATIEVEDTVAHSGQRRTDGVDHGVHGCTILLGPLDTLDDISRLPALRHGYDQCVPVNGVGEVLELRGHYHVAEFAGQPREQIPADEGGESGRAAGCYDHLL